MIKAKKQHTSLKKSQKKGESLTEKLTLKYERTIPILIQKSPYLFLPH